MRDMLAARAAYDATENSSHRRRASAPQGTNRSRDSASARVVARTWTPSATRRCQSSMPTPSAPARVSAGRPPPLASPPPRTPVPARLSAGPAHDSSDSIDVEADGIDSSWLMLQGRISSTFTRYYFSASHSRCRPHAMRAVPPM